MGAVGLARQSDVVASTWHLDAERTEPSFAVGPQGRDPQLEAYQARDSDPSGPSLTSKGNYITSQEQSQ